MRHLLSIDLGTSSVKVLVVTETGQIVGQSSAEYPLHHPRPNWVEQNPDEWWQATATATRQALEATPAPASIAAIGLSGQMHGTVLLDAAGQLLAPAVIWPDQRSQSQVQEITELVGAERLINLTGSPVAVGFQAATLRWFQQKRPEEWSRIAKILLPKDYLRWRLTGEYATDPSDGSGTLLLDARRRDWSIELLDKLEIEARWLPPLQPAETVAGELSPQAAEALGLPPKIPVVTGAADTACGLLGAGVVAAKTLLLTISSGGQIILPALDVQVDRLGRIHTFCGALQPDSTQPGWYQMAAILSAGLSLRWLRDQILGLSGAEAYIQMSAWAEATPVGAEGLLFLPYLAGERTPHMDPQARGLFLGLTARHGRTELTRAVMEGVALACYDAFSVLTELGAQPERIILAGGGSKSTVWIQIMADVFNLPLQSLTVTEQSALGAALLAGGGVGLFDAGATAQRWASYGPSIEPNAEHQAIYQELLTIFRDAYQKHREDFQQLSNL